MRPAVETDGFTLLKLPKNIKQCIKLGYYQEPENSILILPSIGRNLNQSYDPSEYVETEYVPPYGIITQGASNFTLKLPSQVGPKNLNYETYELGDKDKA